LPARNKKLGQRRAIENGRSGVAEEQRFAGPPVRARVPRPPGLSAPSGGAGGAASVAVGISKTPTATKIAQAHGVAPRLDAPAQERPSPDLIMQL
jgi:hypothetical protein